MYLDLVSFWLVWPFGQPIRTNIIQPSLKFCGNFIFHCISLVFGLSNARHTYQITHNSFTKMDLGERGRLLPGSGSHRPEEDGEELRRRGQHDHWHYRSYGGLPVELGVVEEEDFRRIKLPAVTHFFRVALIASVLLIVAAMIANTVVRPSLPMRRGVLGGGPAGESSSTVPHGVPVEKLHGLERAEQQQDLVEVGGVVDGMSDLFFDTDNSNAAAPPQGSSSRRSNKMKGSDTGSSSNNSNNNNNNNNNNNKSSNSRSGTRRSRSKGSSIDGTQEEEEEEQEQPNVIFILIDDAGMNDIGRLSTDLAELAPFVDSLSSQGVRLTKYYTNHLCTPSRVSIRSQYLSVAACQLIQASRDLSSSDVSRLWLSKF